MGAVTEEQPLPEDEDPDEQPIVPMRDLSADEGSADPGTGPAPAVEPPRLRMLGGVLLLFAALGLVVALLVPLYHVGIGEGLRTLGGPGLGADFVVNAWGMVQQGGLPDSVSQLLNVIVGNTPMWGIPLVFVALLLAAAGAIALWQPTVRYVAGGALAATALLVGCFAMLGAFLATAVDPSRIGGSITASIGPGFWLLMVAVLLALAGLAAVLLGRPIPPVAMVAPARREEPPTPPMGFPAPVVLPDLDQK
jgi:hypothetical protein